MRILRIAHASLTPQLRERERALARCYPDVQLEVVTTERWREAEVDVEAIDDDLFPVRKARPHFSRHIQLFVYDPRPIVKALRQFQPDVIDLNAEPFSVQCAEVLTLRNWFERFGVVVSVFVVDVCSRLTVSLICSQRKPRSNLSRPASI